MHLGVGQRFSISGHSFTVVGVVSNRTMLGGNPNVYVTIGDAQKVIYRGLPLIGAVLLKGTPGAIPAGYSSFSNAQIESATIQQLASGVSSIQNSRAFMWVIAAIIVAALVYVTALERTRDFAVLKAVGATTRVLFAGLAAQAIVVALSAAVVAAVLVNFMTGIFAQPVDIPGSAFVVLPLSALAVGLIASLAALRRAASVDPATAFAGA
jgi:putative ABC transport system permease protein